MIIAHLSDLHVSHFGGRLAQQFPLRSARSKGWEPIRQEGQWAIESRRADGRLLRFREQLRLVDDDGVVHRVLKVGLGAGGRQVMIDSLLQLIELRQRTTPHALSRHYPSPWDLERLLARDPDNLNLRFCLVASAMQRDRPDRIIITGDLTDDAVGYELIRTGLGEFFERHQVVCIPGNHDIYPSPPLWVHKAHRKTEAQKRHLWGEFSASIGQPARGSFASELGEGIMLVCLDSCHRGSVPGSASGLVRLSELEHIAQAVDLGHYRLRMACLHHHVVNAPLKGTGMAPIQAGMRLRNAKHVFAALKELRFQLVLNGHRHVGYRFHPARAPLFVSAPSSTIGCQSGEEPYYWKIEIDKEGIRSIRSAAIIKETESAS